jgi:phage-related protein
MEEELLRQAQEKKEIETRLREKLRKQAEEEEKKIAKMSKNEENKDASLYNQAPSYY